MPARDGTGPLSQGPMTGRGQGNCVVPNGSRFFSGYGRSGRRRGLGLGLGLGLGCLRYLANVRKNRLIGESVSEELDKESASEEQEAILEQALSNVRRRIGRT